MPVANTETTEIGQEPSAVDRIADAVRHAAHLSHEARMVTSIARDAGEEGVHAAKRVIRRGVETLEDLKDETAHAVKRQPFRAIAIAAGVGLLVGVVVGWIGDRFGQRQVAKAKWR
jgi:ElaB/YqjD/DUF883 family membrane-anchored ribosome-binding protein